MTEEMLTKCRVCGADILFPANDNSVRHCSYCGRPNSRPRSRPDETRLMKYANERRNMGEFTEAEQAYRKVLQECEEEHEARWGLLLCKYGVIYVEDEKDGTVKITCRRARSSSFRSEEDYKTVISQTEQASDEVCRSYERDAEYIDNIQGEIRKLHEETDPYDVFLCYKETAPEGGKTEDSVLAHRLFNDLTRSGYRVFFAPESLKEKAGANYEAALFVAIEMSRVMLALGTRKEYFESTWVRSEWTRFLDRMDLVQGDQHLIPLFRKEDDLPEAFTNRFIQGAENRGRLLGY